jgi:hypothetical protein
MAYVVSVQRLGAYHFGATSTLLRTSAGRCRFGSWRDLWHPFRTKSEH